MGWEWGSLAVSQSVSQESARTLRAGLARRAWTASLQPTTVADARRPSSQQRQDLTTTTNCAAAFRLLLRTMLFTHGFCPIPLLPTAMCSPKYEIRGAIPRCIIGLCRQNPEVRREPCCRFSSRVKFLVHCLASYCNLLVHVSVSLDLFAHCSLRLRLVETIIQSALEITFLV